MSPSHPQQPRSQPQPQPPRGLLLKRLDQLAVGVLGLLSLVAIGGYWVVQGGARGRLIEIERAAPQHVAFEVDVNSADWPELTVLPNVGETLAKRIVESRREQGPFADLEDLQRVPGIGPKTLEQIRPYLRPLAPSGDVTGR
jgi:competence protein ComEA